MKSLLQRRFQLQLLFALLAAISVAALTVALVANALRHAESFVLIDTNRTLEHALKELRREFDARRQDGFAWSTLSAESQDITLRALSKTVLASYPGVEGGFWWSGQFAGYSYPTHDGGSPKVDVPAAERAVIEGVVNEARQRGAGDRVLRGKRDLVAISARGAGGADGMVVWAMKRLAGEADANAQSGNLLLGVLVGMALSGALGVLATGVGLHRGIAEITAGLGALQTNWSRDLPARRDELGEISAAINEMARTRRRLETELRREDRIRTIGRLVGRIAHEMRNPLNSMRLSLELLAHRQKEGRLAAQDFRMVIAEVDRMNTLLSDLLAFQQPRPPQMEKRALGPVVGECTEFFRAQAAARGVTLKADGTESEEAVFDEQHTRQILTNLLLNALDASAPGGQIRVGVRREEGVVEVEVSDEGPGLSAEQQEHLFEPFYTTKASGHGLGLAVSRELAQSMNGALVWRNRGVGETSGGATFALRLRKDV